MKESGGGEDTHDRPEGFPREATKEVRGLATPEKLAAAVGPPLALMVQRIGGLPVETTAKMLTETLTRDTYLQEIGLARVDPEDALELAAGILLVVHEEVGEED